MRFGLRSRGARAIVALALAGAASVPGNALAAPQGPKTASAADREAARTFAEKGFEQYQAGDCKGARASFEKAEERIHAPPHRLFIARCDAKLGELLAARAIYKEILEEKLPADAPGPFRDAQASARGELDEVEIRLPTLEIALAPGAQANVSVDGQPIAPAELGKPKPFDPGQHTIVARAPDRAPFERTIVLRDGGGAAHVDIVLPASSAAPHDEGSVVPALVAFGVGGVGIVVGSITGAASLGQVGHLNDVCKDKHCTDPSLKSTADSATTLGTISTVSFVAGAVGCAAGATLLVVRPRFGSAPASTGARGPDLRFGFGPGSISAFGRF